MNENGTYNEPTNGMDVKSEIIKFMCKHEHYWSHSQNCRVFSNSPQKKIQTNTYYNIYVSL